MGNISIVGVHCFGCTACQYICPEQCIQMKEDSKGFKYPSIDDDMCTQCGLCKDVCPYLSGYIGGELYPRTQAIAVKHKKENIRQNSSSGGAFTAISDWIINIGGVVYGAGYDENMRVCHQRATSRGQRDKLRGSKYVQSDLQEVFVDVNKDIQNKKQVLFVGTPCQIAGLKNVLGQDYENLFLVDIICHGVPSPKIFREYLEQLEQEKKEKIVDCKFRDKSEGWRNLTLSIDFNSSKIVLNSSESSFYNLFLNNTMLRPNCYECPYTNFNRPSDLTIGDFWGIENTFIDFDDNKGISLVLVNTTKGKHLIHNIGVEIEMKEATHEQCMQDRLHSPTAPHEHSDSFWEDYGAKGFAYVAEKYGVLT